MYQVDTVRDNVQNLSEVLQDIASREDHGRIVSITWQPARDDGNGLILNAGYTIVSERRG
jgi:hypothetical protein